MDFSVEKKEPKKSRLAILPQTLLSLGIFRKLYIGRYFYFLSPLARSKSQRRLLLSTFMAHAFYNLSSFGIPRMGAFCIASLRPRHVRHPSAAQMEIRR